jgi:hypothetical protein
MVRVKVTPAQTETSRVLHADDLSQLKTDVRALEADAQSAETAKLVWRARIKKLD